MEGYDLLTDSSLEVHGLCRAATYISSNMRYMHRTELEVQGEPVIWLTIYPNNQKPINVQKIYRQWQIVTNTGAVPNTKGVNHQLQRLGPITNNWYKAMQEYETISTSDTNIDTTVDWTDNQSLDTQNKRLLPIYQHIKSQILDKGGAIIPTPPTKTTPHRKDSCLDHMITNQPTRIIQAQVVKEGTSDHFPIKFTRFFKEPINHQKYFFTRKFSEINWDQMNGDIIANPLHLNALNSDDPDEIASLLTQLVQKGLDTQAPIHKVQFSTAIPTFATEETRSLIKDRDSALQKAKETSNEDDFRLYRSLRNRTHKSLTQDKKDKVTQDILSIERDPKQMWTHTKQLIGWNRGQTPNLLVNGGQVITNTKTIANTINREHILRNIRLRRAVPKTDTNPLTNYHKLKVKDDTKFELKQITMHEFRTIYKKIKPTNSTAYDNISTKTLKKLTKSTEAILLHLINTSIETQIYPNILKEAKIIPLLKHDKVKTDPLSYKGINLLPSIGKIMDKVTASQITKYLTQHKLIPHQHHGGLKGKSTITAVLTEIDKWAEKVENGEDLAVIIIDQSAAYDTIDHGLLVEKLKILGFQPNSIKYMQNYLCNRQQSVYIDGTRSDNLHTGNMSVVQGSVLGCLLYLIYVMDLPIIFQEIALSIQQEEESSVPTSTTFVDDTTTTIQMDKQTNYQSQIDATMYKLQDYMNSNSLTMNPSKTQLLIFSKNSELKNSLKIKDTKKDITPTNNFTYLGIEIDTSLKWNYNITDSKKSVMKQLNTRLNALILARKHMKTKTLLQVANGIFYSKLLYGIEVWGNCPSYLKHKVQVILLRAARLIIGKKSQRWHTKKILNEVGWHTIDEIATLTSVKLAHKMLHTSQPESLAYRTLKHKTDASTRLSGPNKLGPRPRTYGGGTYTKYQIRAGIYSKYNSIPEPIQNIMDQHRFKKWTKKYLTNPAIKLPASTPIAKQK